MQPKAPELRVPFWYGADGAPLSDLKLADLGTGFKVIFAFKAMCPGCHSFGFPTMKTIYDGLKDKGVGMAVRRELSDLHARLQNARNAFFHHPKPAE